MTTTNRHIGQLSGPAKTRWVRPWPPVNIETCTGTARHTINDSVQHTKSYDGGGEEEEVLVVNVGDVLMYLCSSVDHVVVS